MEGFNPEEIIKTIDVEVIVREFSKARNGKDSHVMVAGN